MSTEIEQQPQQLNGVEHQQQQQHHIKNVDEEPRPAQPPSDAPLPQQHTHNNTSLPNSPESSPKGQKKLSAASPPASPTHSHKSSASSTGSHKRTPFDTRLMTGFYEACVSKFFEQEKEWSVDWQPKEQQQQPFEISKKSRVYDMVRKYMQEQKEPVVLMQNFDYSDLQSFESFLQTLKYDGLNSIGKYRHYLESRDMNKANLDLVIFHAKYGIILIEVKESDYMDNKRRMKIKNQLSAVGASFESLVRLIADAKGLRGAEQPKLPIYEVLALPNVHERPKNQERPVQMDKNGKPHVAASKDSEREQQQKEKPLNYLIKSDMDDFGKWWRETIVEKFVEQPADKKTVVHTYTSVLSVLNTVRNNLVIPTINEEIEKVLVHKKADDKKPEDKDEKKPTESSVDVSKTDVKEDGEEDDKKRFTVCAEFFDEKHEKLRTWSKVCLASNDKDKLRRSVAMQILWVLLNDAQKKLSVVTADKQWFEEYFSKQRRLYANSINNVRFYTDMQSCADTTESHTLRKDNDVWLFVTDKTHVADVFEKSKDLRSYWIFVQEPERVQLGEQLAKRNGDVKYADLDEQTEMDRALMDTKPWLSDLKLKFPIRLQTDLLIIGDVIPQGQSKLMGDYLRDSLQTKYYQPLASRLRQVKYLRGNSAEYLRQTLKMHDAIQAKIVLIHIGDEDLQKTRNPQATVELIKELTQLVKQYCPKSFVVISTLMRRYSKSEAVMVNDVNKGIVNFCKQSKDTFNYHYMLNNHFEPGYDIYDQQLNNKGLRLYVDNILFVVDYFYGRKSNQKQ